MNNKFFSVIAIFIGLSFGVNAATTVTTDNAGDVVLANENVTLVF